MTSIAVTSPRPALLAGRSVVFAALALTILLWSSAFVFIRSAVPVVGWQALVSSRIILGALVLFAIAAARGIQRPTRTQWPALAFLGLLGYGAYQTLLTASERTLSAGTAGLLFTAAPVLSALLGARFLGERLDHRRLGGMGLAIPGAALAVLGGHGVSGDARGALLMAIGVVLYAIWIVLQKKVLRGMGALDAATWSMGFSALGVLPLAGHIPAGLESAPASAIGSVLILGLVITTLPVFLWGWCLARLDASIAGPSLLMVGPTSVLMGWAALGEAPGAPALAGAALAATGVVHLLRSAYASPSGDRPPRA